MPRISRSTLLACVALALLGAAPAAAVMVAPHALFLDHRERAGVFFLHNPGDDPVEVEVELVFGYPQSDSLGGVHVTLQPTPPAHEPSCANWVVALPRKVRLAPGQRQAVRLLARPPADLADGEYWSRLLITSRQSGKIEAIGENGDIRVGLDMATRTITSLIYRKGEVWTSAQVDSLGAIRTDDGLQVILDMRRTGSGAWLGKLDLEIYDRTGTLVHRADRALAAYYDLYRRLNFALPALPPGDYSARMRLHTTRDDLQPGQALPAPEVVREEVFRIDGTKLGR